MMSVLNTATTAEPDRNPNAALEREVVVVLQELRPALAAVLDRLSPPITRVTDLRRRLNLDQKLSWSIFNAATARDTRALASLLPRQRAMGRFFAAAAIQGAPAETIDRARAAFERFEECVSRHAGSRDAFEAIVAGIGGPMGRAGNAVSAAADARQKRAMFRAASLLWGRQARVAFSAMVVHPSPRTGDPSAPQLLDRLIVKGMIGLRQTRHGVPLQTMARRWHKPMAGDPTGPLLFEALDPREAAIGEDSIGLLRDFCSQPPPTFRINTIEEGFTGHELVATGVGATSEVTYFTGHRIHASTVVPGTVPGSELTSVKTVDMPIEVSIMDCLMHESVWNEELPEVDMYAFPIVGSPSEFKESDRLPLSASATYLGRGLDAGRTTVMPRYVELLAYALERVGWNPDEFRSFRCRVDHPLPYSRIRVRFAR